MLVATAILSATTLIAIFYFLTISKHFLTAFLQLSKIPGPPKTGVLIGNFMELPVCKEKLFQKLRELNEKYFPIYSISFLHNFVVSILCPEDCEQILSNPKHFEKSRIYELVHDWLGTGLLTSGGSKWPIRRKILTPAFHFSILQQFVHVFNEQVELLVQTLNGQCEKPFVDITPHLTQFTLNTIAETAMGTKLQSNTTKEQEYKKNIVEISDFFLFRLLNPWYMNNLLRYFSPTFKAEKKAIKVLHRFTTEVISEREKNFNEVDLTEEKHDVYVGKRRLAMLDLLLMAKNKEGSIDLEGIREEVDTFMFEGHDTTSAAIGFALMLLANHKNVQDRIYQEIVNVLGDTKKNPTYNDLQEMRYMEQVIKEVLRLYPSVHFISRKLGEDMVSNSGYHLPKDTIVVLHIYDIHHSSDIYPDPEKFDPDRFHPDNSKNRHPFAFLPFSAGLRNCIGRRFAMLEIKAFLCGILSKFVLEPVDTPATIVLIVDIVLRTKDPIKVKFAQRI